MKNIILSRKRDLWGGVLIALCGVFTIMEANTYRIGELARMGPGYFPMLVGCFLVVLGILIPFASDPDETQEAQLEAQLPPTPRRERLRGMTCIAGGIAAFAIVGHFLGFLPATFALVFIAALGDCSNTVRSAALLALIMSILGAVIFSWGLQLQFPMLRWEW